MNIVSKFLVIVLATILAGCSTVYSDKSASNLSDSEVAILNVPDPAYQSMYLEDVDGHSRGIGFFDAYRIGPGKHSLGFQFNRANWFGEKVVRWIDAKAGGRYVVKQVTNYEAKSWNVWIIDQATGQRIDYDDPSR